MITWAYIAGFFDGEGHIGFKQSNGRAPYPRISIAQAGDRGQKALENVQKFLASVGITQTAIYVQKPHGIQKKNCYSLNINARKPVVAFCKNVLPYLQIKKTETQDILRYLILYSSKRRIS